MAMGCSGVPEIETFVTLIVIAADQIVGVELVTLGRNRIEQIDDGIHTRISCSMRRLVGSSRAPDFMTA